MAEFDPVPKLNPFFKGLVSAALMLGIGLAFWGLGLMAVAVLVRAWP